MFFKAIRTAGVSGKKTVTNAGIRRKMIPLCILILSLLAFSSIQAQQITLQEKNAPLEKVFKKITAQTGVLFVYRDEWMKQTKRVSLNVQNAGLKQVLAICFENQPYIYEIIDNMVVLKEKTAPAQGITPAQGQGMLNLSGRITDSTGTALAGAALILKGTKKGAASDVHGEFDIRSVPVGSVVVVSYTGYEDYTFSVNTETNGRYYIILNRSANVLDETIVQAYGTTSKRFNVGSIATIDAATIQRQPVSNPLLALQGQVSGLAVNATSGVPGSSVQLQIRGQNTLLSNPNSFKPYDQPLLIVDGVPFAAQNNSISQLSSLASPRGYSGDISQPAGMSAFNGINPADIESVSVLKDADATSIYGSQGANGVILITTKKGKSGKTSYNITANTGFNSTARTIKLMNTDQYLQMRKDAFAIDGITPSSSVFDNGFAPDLTIYDQNKYTNWQNVIFGKTSNNTDVHVSVSGGTANTTFVSSAGYTRSTYNFPGSYSDQRFTLHNVFHHLSSDDRFSLDFTFDYGYDRNNSPGFGATQSILSPPNLPDLLDNSGNLIWDYNGISISSYQFYAYLKMPVLMQAYNMNNALRLGYKFNSRLSFAMNLGYNRNNNTEHSELPGAAQNPAYITRRANFANNTFQTINIEPQLDYNINIGGGSLSALLGGTYKKNMNNSSAISGFGYANDNLLGSINGAATLTSYDNNSLYKYAAVFARLRYIYRQRYILSLAGRRDGSSNFGPNRQFGNFGSVGAGWIFSEEKGFKEAIPVISFGKLSGSYGTSGSDGVAPYNYQSFWKITSFVKPFQQVVPSIPQNLYNPDYSWAKKKSLNLSLDLGLWHDRLLLKGAYYDNREGNQLGGYPLGYQTGFNSVLQNIPAVVKNYGWEFSFTSQNIKRPSFSWTSNFNISFNRNKLISFPNLSNSSYSLRYAVGQPTSIVFGYRYKGVNPATGLFEFYDRNGDATSSPTYALPERGGDLYPIANREVKYMGGFGNTFTYKRVSLFLFCQFAKQTAPTYLHTIYNNFTPGLNLYNQPVEVAGQYWKKAGDEAMLQRLTASYSSQAYNAASNFGISSGVYGDDTYLRLKTLSLSYDLPEKWLQRLHVRDCRLYVNAQNLFTVTNYKVADPETFGDYTTFPVQRVVAFGLNLNF